MEKTINYDVINDIIVKTDSIAENLGINFYNSTNKEQILILNKDNDLNIKQFNLLLALNMNMRHSNEKYQNEEFRSFEDDFYIGELDAISDLKEALNKDNFKINDVPVKFDVTFFDPSELEIEYSQFNHYINNMNNLISNNIIHNLKESESLNVYNSQEAKDKFIELANGQRGKPEILMVHCQHLLGGGVLSHAIEHIGDLTHRMSEAYAVEYDSFSSSLEYFKPKVDKMYNLLNSSYGFEKEFLENCTNNHRFYNESGKTNKDFDNWFVDIKKELKKYSEAHSELTVYNEPQFHAREAAVSLGELRFDDCLEHLKYLKELIQNQEYVLKASQYDPNFKMQLKSKNKIKPKI